MTKFFKCILFISLFSVIFKTISVILLLKDNNFYKYRNYLQQDTNSFDVIYMGSSHSEAGIMPNLIDEELGITSFNYSVTGMRIEQAYYRLEDALKTQNPKLIVLDTFSFTPVANEHIEVLARWAFDMLPLSVNKIYAIRYNVFDRDRSSYYIPFLKYHTRWKELNENDIKILYDNSFYETAGFLGASTDTFMNETDDYFDFDFETIVETRKINEREQESFEKFLELAKKNNIDVLLITVPFKNQLGMDNKELTKINRYLEQTYVNRDTVKMLDLNLYLDEMEFGYHDLFNEGHVNRYGAEKVSKLLAKYIKKEYSELVVK